MSSNPIEIKNPEFRQLAAQLDDFRIESSKRLDAALILAKKFEPDLSSVCEIDLHCHSFYSDGYCSPANRVFEAFRRKMKAIAISDHDLFDGQIEALDAGKIFGVDIIPAVEFYTDRPGIEIIGHFPDPDIFLNLIKSGKTDSDIEKIRKAKKKQLQGMLQRIPECFAKFAFKAEILPEDIDRYLRNGISSKGDISVLMWQKYANELKKRGISCDVKDFQARYTTQDNMLNLPLEIDIDISPKAFIRRILDWGGLPGLSHPTEIRNKEKLGNCEIRKIIEELGNYGLETIEVDGWRNGICPESGIHQTLLFDQMRKEYNEKHKERLPLLFTNGSDDHNQPGEGLELGCGKNNNLNPDYGKYENINTLRIRTSIKKAKI